MGKAKASPVNLDGLTGELANLRLVAGDEMMQEAFAICRANLGLTASTLAVMIQRVVAPERLLAVPEECALRGVTDKPLKAMKDAKELPRVLSGRQ